ncbi:hypothetical protein [Gemmatimonas sp.]|uniref:hypothetical protein n=1 Tax=Gemmatimonas sp. TaxID=1962908 RepID=UPI002EDA7932
MSSIRFAVLARASVLAALSVAVPAVASAQVGHQPSASPYEDFKIGQTLTIMAGWLAIKRDPADVASKSSAMGSLRYDLGVGGPVSLYARYLLAPSERKVLVPNNPRATRVLRMESANTHVMDLGLDISLTGKKTWHNLMPSVNFGGGIASNFAAVDTGAYRFGSKFALTYGASLRYLPRKGPQVRIDIGRYMWKYEYPDRYFVKASDTTSVLTDTRQRSAWRTNWGVSAGVSVPLFR